MKFGIFYLLSLTLIITSIISCTGISPETKELLISPERQLINYALSSNGATAESPDNNPDHPPSEVIDGDTSSLDWDSGGGWEGNLSHLRSSEPLKRSYVQINLPTKVQVKRIVVYTIDSPKYPADKYGLNTYTLEYWHGTGWRAVEVVNGSNDKRFTVKGNKQGKIVHEIKGELITDKIRLTPYSSNDTQKEYDLTAFGARPIYEVTGSSKVIEIEVWGYPAPVEKTRPETANNLFPIGKPQPSEDEIAIMKLLSEYEQGYDNESIDQVMSVFSDNFRTLDGKDKESIRQKASKFFEDYNKVNMTIRDPKINISESKDTALVEAYYTLECVAVADNNTYRRSGTLLLNLQKEENEWRIVNAK